MERRLCLTTGDISASGERRGDKGRGDLSRSTDPQAHHPIPPTPPPRTTPPPQPPHPAPLPPPPPSPSPHRPPSLSPLLPTPFPLNSALTCCSTRSTHASNFASASVWSFFFLSASSARSFLPSLTICRTTSLPDLPHSTRSPHAPPQPTPPSHPPITSPPPTALSLTPRDPLSS
ncbi:unnamed protein product [Closterium sp. NIES-54]